ncbi:hypothetical protein [Streptomyces sp. 351MFTsu5.1]|uniref:hypothetical protein n=1 Tax=Streptomyces sp. 351MFTsu5.1 TaxID=1172180 RepID=UPI00037F2829|nr:hypothetical protein [Streptomyces sp. 351MFTsu5.1]
MDGHLSHVLGLTSPDAHVMTGSYAYSGWNVVHVAGTGLLRAMMPTQHEAEHAALNASSAWGTALLAFHVAHLKTGDPTYLDTLRELVERCRTTHEAYATHASVLGICSRSELTPEELLADYPEYVRFHELAQRTGPDPETLPYWHGVAVESALMACMQTPILDRLAECGFARFSPPARVLRDSDSPDARFRALRRQNTGLWTELERMLADALGSEVWEQLRHTATADIEGVGAFGTEVWNRLQAVTFTTASSALRELGFATPTIEAMMAASEETLKILRGVVPEAERIFVPPGSFHTDALSLFELENLTLRTPRPARVRRWADRGATALTSGASPRTHVYVCVRSLERLRVQFDLDAGHLADLAPLTPVVAVLVPADERTGRPVELFVVDDPGQLAEIPAAGTDLGVVVNYSLACSLRRTWATAWLPRLRTLGETTALFDTLPRRTVPLLLESGHPLRYALIAVRDGGHESFVLCVRLGDDPLLLLPCSFAAGQAMASWIHYASGERLRSDLAVLGRDEQHLVPVVVGHLVGEEAVIGFWAA